MRILQVVHGYPPQEWGGAELVTATLAQALAERGHRVTVFARTADTPAEEFSVRDDEPDTPADTDAQVRVGRPRHATGRRVCGVAWVRV